MANPFLVLGGVAVGVITAGIGVLSVPGWIDAANDSAAINDLGNIRGAESAAILHLGEYTDDFGVLRSGELGVKFQKSDGVTLIGLKADTSESWCAAVQSKSGRFFAASNVQAAIATGPGAEAAMTAANCDPALISVIIDEATNHVPPIGTGTPGTGGGTWVGGPVAGGGGGGGTVLANCLQNPGVAGTPSALGEAVAVGTEISSAAWTPSGLFALSGSSTDGILRIGDDGRAHTFALSGPAAEDPWFNPTFPVGKVTADRYGNMYVSSVAGPEKNLYRVAPDGVTDLVETWSYDDGLYVYPAVSPNGTLYWAHDGEVTRCNIDGTQTVLGSVPGFTFAAGFAADDLGNTYLSDGNDLWVINDGGVRALPMVDESSQKVFATHIAVTAAGELFVTSDSRIWSVDEATGAATVYASPTTDAGGSGWGSPRLLGADESGTLFYALNFANGVIWSIGTDGRYSEVANGN